MTIMLFILFDEMKHYSKVDKTTQPVDASFVFCIFRFLRNSINCQNIVLTHVHVCKEYIKYKINEF